MNKFTSLGGFALTAALLASCGQNVPQQEAQQGGSAVIAQAITSRDVKFMVLSSGVAECQDMSVQIIQSDDWRLPVMSWSVSARTVSDPAYNARTLTVDQNYNWDIVATCTNPKNGYNATSGYALYRKGQSFATVKTNYLFSHESMKPLWVNYGVYYTNWEIPMTLGSAYPDNGVYGPANKPRGGTSTY